MSKVLLPAAQAALGELGGAGINLGVLVARARFQRGRRPLGWAMTPHGTRCPDLYPIGQVEVVVR